MFFAKKNHFSFGKSSKYFLKDGPYYSHVLTFDLVTPVLTESYLGVFRGLVWWKATSGATAGFTAGAIWRAPVSLLGDLLRPLR